MVAAEEEDATHRQFPPIAPAIVAAEEEDATHRQFPPMAPAIVAAEDPFDSILEEAAEISPSQEDLLRLSPFVLTRFSSSSSSFSSGEGDEIEPHPITMRSASDTHSSSSSSSFPLRPPALLSPPLISRLGSAILIADILSSTRSFPSSSSFSSGESDEDGSEGGATAARYRIEAYPITMRSASGTDSSNDDDDDGVAGQQGGQNPWDGIEQQRPGVGGSGEWPPWD